jgi:hypothetical protein
LTLTRKIKFELKICRKLQWCHYDKQLEQNKQIDKDKRTYHTNELKNAQLRKNSNCNMNEKKERGDQSCSHYGLYNSKNQKFGYGAQDHHLED